MKIPQYVTIGLFLALFVRAAQSQPSADLSLIIPYTMNSGAFRPKCFCTISVWTSLAMRPCAHWDLRRQWPA